MSQLAGVNPAKTDNMVFFQEMINIIIHSEIGRRITPFPHQIPFCVTFSACIIFFIGAVIANQRKGLCHDLPMIIGIAECFLISGCRGGEYDFSDYRSLCTKAFALKFHSVC